MGVFDRIARALRRVREFILPIREYKEPPKPPVLRPPVPEVKVPPPPPPRPPRRVKEDLTERIKEYIPKSQQYSRYGTLRPLSDELKDKFTHGDEARAERWTRSFYRDGVDEFLERRRAGDWIILHTDQLSEQQKKSLEKERLPAEGSFAVVFTAKGKQLEPFERIRKAKSKIMFVRIDPETGKEKLITWTTRGRYESFTRRQYRYESPIRTTKDVKEINDQLRTAYLYPDEKSLPPIPPTEPEPDIEIDFIEPEVEPEVEPEIPPVPTPPFPEPPPTQTKGSDYFIDDFTLDVASEIPTDVGIAIPIRRSG